MRRPPDDPGARDCPTLALLEEHARGLLDEPQIARLRQHLDVCQACRSTLEDLEFGEHCGRQLREAGPTLDAGAPPIVTTVTGPGVDVPTSIPPSDIPDYDMERRLAKGGFGEVWLARSKTGVYRAVKVLAKGEVSAVEFRGVESFARHGHGHPHLIEMLHVGELEQSFYYVMELADGYELEPTFSPDDYEAKTLGSELKRRGVLPLEEAFDITRQVLSGLGHLHRRDLLHRDVKPGNVVFVKGAVKLADVGLLTREDDHSTAARTPGYAPPEGVRDRGGDLYCVGKMLFEMVAGRLPEEYSELLEPGGDDKRRAVERIEPLIARACAPDAAERFERTEEFLAAIDAVDRRPAAAGGAQRRWRQLAWCGAVAVSAVAACVLLFEGRQSPLPADSDWRLHLLCRDPAAKGVHFRVMPGNLPLRTGQSVKLEAEWDQPAYPMVVVLSDSKGAQIAYPRDPGSQKRLTRLELPGGEDWWKIDPPDETLTFLLLVGDSPIDDSAALRGRLASLGDFPRLAPNVMLEVVDGEVLRLGGQPGRERGIDVTRSVLGERGFLERLPAEALGADLRLVAAVAVPHVTPE